LKIFIFLMIISAIAKAESFRIAGENIDFELKEELLIAKCEKQCLALKKITQFRSIDLKKVRAHQQFIGSTGSDVCQFIYRAKSVIGIAANRDQRAFCVFEDKSIIEINSLSQYLESRKIIAR
jgi:hypothetical protein